MSNHHIELNGNAYDTRTGKIVQKESSPQRSGVSRPSIDGFQRPKMTSQPRPHQPQHNKKPLEKSQTLMRHAVEKPAKQPSETPRSAPDSKKSLFNTQRLERAKKTPKSGLIQKFQKSSSEQPAVQPERIDPKPIHPVQSPRPSIDQTAKPHKKSLAEAALERADAHEQPEYVISRWSSLKRRISAIPKPVTFGIAGLAAMAMLGLGWYLALPNASMQLAANRSGIDATIPNYRPAGYQLNRSIEYEPGKVQMHFNTPVDNRSFSIKKEKTDWTSDRLRQHVAEHAETYQAVNHKGSTIFVYGNGNAMWVDGGIHYTIQGAYSLNSDQLIRLVESL